MLTSLKENIIMKRKLATLALLLGVHGSAFAAVTAQRVERIGPDKIAVTWTDANPVDVYVSGQPSSDLKSARLVAHADSEGRFEMAAAAAARSYFLLKDSRDGAVVRVAERVVPLQQGSNFRDVGGYPAAGGKHVRWGLIFRSGGTPMLTDADLATIQGLGLQTMIDLRSSEERVLAPTRIEGVRYTAVGYSMAAVTGSGSVTSGSGLNSVYRRFPTMLAPQLRILFASLVAGEGPVVYNCSAGQDRTGFATAMVLSALGVPRDVILADYHLSTLYRRPAYEMPRIDPARASESAGAAFFVKVQSDPGANTPKPLYDAQQHALLEAAFAEIDSHWGSVDAYLDKALGVTPADIARLRAQYLE